MQSVVWEEIFKSFDTPIDDEADCGAHQHNRDQENDIWKQDKHPVFDRRICNEDYKKGHNSWKKDFSL